MRYVGMMEFLLDYCPRLHMKFPSERAITVFESSVFNGNFEVIWIFLSLVIVSPSSTRASRILYKAAGSILICGSPDVLVYVHNYLIDYAYERNTETFLANTMLTDWDALYRELDKVIGPVKKRLKGALMVFRLLYEPRMPNSLNLEFSQTLRLCNVAAYFHGIRLYLIHQRFGEKYPCVPAELLPAIDKDLVDNMRIPWTSRRNKLSIFSLILN